jgi:hypothetical protein
MANNRQVEVSINLEKLVQDGLTIQLRYMRFLVKVGLWLAFLFALCVAALYFWLDYEKQNNPEWYYTQFTSKAAEDGYVYKNVYKGPRIEWAADGRPCPTHDCVGGYQTDDEKNKAMAAQQAAYDAQMAERAKQNGQ